MLRSKELQVRRMGGEEGGGFIVGDERILCSFKCDSEDSTTRLGYMRFFVNRYAQRKPKHHTPTHAILH